LNYYLPLVSVIVANIFYHNIAKCQPVNANPYLSLTISYIVSAILTFLLFCFYNGNIKNDIVNLNWTSFLLGLAIVGIELGYILLYRNGWTISTAALTANIIVAILLLFIGFLVYRENISAFQIIGTILCIIGLWLINIKGR